MEKVREVQPTMKGMVLSRESLRRQDLLTPSLWGVFLSGVLIGACRSGEELSALTGQFLAIRGAGDWQQAFLSAMISAGGMLAMLFVSGFCAVGQPGAVLVLLIRGLGLGGCAGELYRQLGFEGMGCVLLLLVLPELLTSFCFLQGTKGAVRMSARLFGAMISGEPPVLLPHVKRYGVKFVILFVLVAVSAGINGFCAGVVGPLIC